MRWIYRGILALFFMAFSIFIHADQTFLSSRNVTIDAQVIRLKAIEMGWHVNKPVSLVTAGIIFGKDVIYPKADVEITMKEMDGELEMKVQVKSKDAGKAEWHKLWAKKKK